MLRQSPRRARKGANLSSREDLYNPDSPGFAERNVEQVKEVPDLPGLVRIDIGSAV